MVPLAVVANHLWVVVEPPSGFGETVHDAASSQVLVGVVVSAIGDCLAPKSEPVSAGLDVYPVLPSDMENERATNHWW